MFKLALTRGGDAGLYCGREGLFLGLGPLVERVGDEYKIRADDEIVMLLAAAYKPEDAATRLLPRLHLIRDALQQGDVCKASILAVHARLGPLSSEGLDRLQKLAKQNFDPAQPRDWHGRWTASESAVAQGNATQEGHPGLVPTAHIQRPSPSQGANQEDHPALIPVQEILIPFAARPPFFFEDPPKTFRPFKEPIPRLSGKEGAKDTPSWARGQRPYFGENGRDFAKRLMDERYGRGHLKKEDPEYDKIKKYGDRSFRNPRSILLPDDDEI